MKLRKKIILYATLASFCCCTQKHQIGSDAGKLLPVPQQMSFSGRNFSLDNTWTIIAENLNNDEPAIKSLISGLNERGRLQIASGNQQAKKNLIRLNVNPGAVKIGSCDTLTEAMTDQAYNLKLDPHSIVISANSPAGLFYGVQTLLQLVTKKNGMIFLPEGEINDHPDLEVRIIFWDCSHHLERMETFKRAIRQAAYFKINAIALKLEGHFLFKSATPVAEPNALTTEEYQELTDYALANYVQLIPYLDAPGHVSFILKHPEYAGLRAIPNINYEFGITNEKTYKLLNGMFGDLIDANKGGKYMLLSTDEAYYAGKAESEREAAKAAGGNGKLLAHFIRRMADYLHNNGRTVISWIEYPLTSSDIDSLPSHLINGVYNAEWTPAFRSHGMKQFIYTSTQGEEPLFPNYYPLPEKYRGRNDASKGRVEEIIETIRESVAHGKSDIPGVIVAAWSDAGLHPETFWLGYTTGTAAAWNLKNLDAKDLTNRFYAAFYGPETTYIDSIYSLLSNQAEFWKNSWNEVPSSLRSPILGNSEGIFDHPQPATDQSLPLPPAPSATNQTINQLSENFQERDSAAKFFLKQNDELIKLLNENISKADLQKHNLEVLLSIASLCRHNLSMIIGLNEITKNMKSAAESTDPKIAISFIDKALDKAKSITDERNVVFTSLKELWYQDWYPFTEEADGRKFLFRVDDIKDHLPGRTTDLSYLIYREMNYPLDEWREKTSLIYHKDLFRGPGR